MVDKIETRATGHGNGGLRIIIPAKLHHDSKNPIKPGTAIEIAVDGKRMTITPLKGAPPIIPSGKTEAI